jgi:hypothetical protein
MIRIAGEDRARFSVGEPGPVALRMAWLLGPTVRGDTLDGPERSSQWVT